MRSVDAVNPAVSTTAPAPTVMPAGLTSTSRPLEPSEPKMALGSGPTTRLMEVLVLPGCANQVLMPAGMPKLCQLIAEWLVPGPLRVVISSELPWLAKVAWPAMTCAPAGWARTTAGMALNAAERATTSKVGRKADPRRASGISGLQSGMLAVEAGLPASR